MSATIPLTSSFLAPAQPRTLPTLALTSRSHGRSSSVIDTARSSPRGRRPYKVSIGLKTRTSRKLQANERFRCPPGKKAAPTANEIDELEARTDNLLAESEALSAKTRAILAEAAAALAAGKGSSVAANPKVKEAGWKTKTAGSKAKAPSPSPKAKAAAGSSTSGRSSATPALDEVLAKMRITWDEAAEQFLAMPQELLMATASELEGEAVLNKWRAHMGPLDRRVLAPVGPAPALETQGQVRRVLHGGGAAMHGVDRNQDDQANTQQTAMGEEVAMVVRTRFTSPARQC
ncbi:hypothetical protein FRC08_013189 [Ceratobasidium sp. 394]|nr:hypothetical protein FRC08_013189 [Ceratobasidium sp. 394]